MFIQPNKPMDDDALRAVINSRLMVTTANLAATVATDRARQLQYYLGQPFGNEVDGRSKVVSHDVAEAIDGMMPSLLKVFASGDRVVEFKPRKPQDEDIAAQATDYVNWVWTDQNPGFQTMYTWFKDALLQRVGAIKIWWDETNKVSKESYEGLTDIELQELENDEGIEITKQRDYPMQLPQHLLGMLPPGAVPVPPTLHDVDVTITRPGGRVCIEPLPPEEFLWDYYAKDVEHARILAHRVEYTISELRELGYSDELIEQIPPGDYLNYSPDRLARFNEQNSLFYQSETDPDPNSRRVWVTECYTRIDYDGDGYAEMRKVTVAGSQSNVLLDNEEVDSHPFAVLTPTIMPHRIEGISIADQTMDLQEIKSTLWRQTLDNLYLANNPQWEVVAGQVEIDDLLISRPGGIKRVKAPGMLRALETPFVAGNTMPMIDYIDKVRELRTGMPEAGGELSADVLNNSATGANIVNNTRLERVELITRTFAETGVKQAFKRILELVQKYQDQKQTIKLRGNWVDVDPREWRTEFDMQIQVGLGSGNKDQMLAHLMPIKQTQEQILLQLGPQNPLVSLQNYFHTLAAMVKNANLGDVDQYFQNPSQQPPQPPQPPKPDPAAQKAQMDAQIAQQQGQQQMQLAQAKAQLEQQVAQQKMGLEQQRAQQEMQINQQQAEHQMQLQAMKVRADIEIAQVKAQADIAVAQRKDAMQIAAAKDGVDVE